MCISRYINEKYSHPAKIREVAGANRFSVKFALN